MPDTHTGAGCVIGTTMTITDKVCPSLVGVDIGCGMLTARLTNTDIDFEKLDKVIKEKIPSGRNIHDKEISCKGELKIEDLYAPVDKSRAYKSIGTLGGGNHFIEIDIDSEDKYWIVIHSGSRHLGLEVCKYYQNEAYNNLINMKNAKEELINKLRRENREKDIQSEIEKLPKPTISKDLAYCEGELFDKYIHDMYITQDYANFNRYTMLKLICRYMEFNYDLAFTTIHNYIDQDLILRKGAVSAKEDESLIIPMNMRDGSLLCIGKGNPDWNYSAPHGAGRIMSRGQAKENISMEEYIESMNGIYTTSVSPSTIDESPMVYKPMDEIIKNIKDTVDVLDIIKPVYNFKASE